MIEFILYKNEKNTYIAMIREDIDENIYKFRYRYYFLQRIPKKRITKIMFKEISSITSVKPYFGDIGCINCILGEYNNTIVYNYII